MNNIGLRLAVDVDLKRSTVDDVFVGNSHEVEELLLKPIGCVVGRKRLLEVGDGQKELQRLQEKMERSESSRRGRKPNALDGSNCLSACVSKPLV